MVVTRIYSLIIVLAIVLTLLFLIIPAQPVSGAAEEWTPGTVRIWPNGDAGAQQWGTYPAGGFHYAKILDYYRDDDATYIFGNATSKRDLLTFDSVSGYAGPINYINAVAYMRHVGGAGDTTTVRFVYETIGGTPYYSSDKTISSGSSYVAVSSVWSVNPDTGNAWTWAELEDIYIGLQTRTVGATMRCTQLFIDINYIPPDPPSVSTSAATTVRMASAVLNGAITNTGNDNPSVRGFDYGLTGSYGSEWTESGNFTVASYNANVTSLSKGTQYYFRAKAYNVAGWGYGSQLTFTTKPDPPANLTASSIDQDEATITWNKGTGATYTMLRYKTTGYPTSTSDGTLMYLDTGATTPMTSLLANTTYYISGWSRAGASTYSLSYDTANFTTLSHIVPTIVTQPATRVSYTSARLNASVVDDGGSSGASFGIRFGYGNESEAIFEDYQYHTSWVWGWSEGDSAYVDLVTLDPASKYYWNVQAMNVAGNSTGAVRTFTTGNNLGTPGNLDAIPSSTEISLSWNKGNNSARTLVRYSTITYPANITAGTQGYLGDDTSYILDELVSGTTYYISAWGAGYGAYSTNSTTVMITTNAAVASEGEIGEADVPSGWYQSPDPDALENFEPLYSALNGTLDKLEIPRASGWLAVALGFCMVIGLVVMWASRSAIGGGIALIACMLLVGTQGLIPTWMMYASLLLLVGMAGLLGRQSA